MASAQDIKPPLTLEGLATLFRQDVDDLPGDTVTDVNWKNDDTGLLWSNQEICRYANQAETEFCFRNPIPDRDVDQTITHVAFTGGTQKGILDPKILAIYRAKFVETATGDEIHLQKRTVQWMDRYIAEWDLESNSSLQGDPKYYIEDANGNSVFLYPIPEANGTLHLNVGRLPSSSMLWSRRHLDGPEIDAEHHLCLLDYMKYLAFRKRDAETENKELAEEHYQSFEMHAGVRPDARLLRVRKQERNYPRRVRAQYF
jgi:hypothetical protein